MHFGDFGMKTERDVRERLFFIARRIDMHTKDTHYDIARFHDLLWVLELGESFRKNLLPDRIQRSASGKVVEHKNYSRTLEKVFNTQLSDTQKK